MAGTAEQGLSYRSHCESFLGVSSHTTAWPMMKPVNSKGSALRITRLIDENEHTGADSGGGNPSGQ
jgi:hypothetical protein